MLKFENNHIITGYIKQLLKDFNLPKCKVYVEGTTDAHLLESKLVNGSADFPVTFTYIKDDRLQVYTNTAQSEGLAWKDLHYNKATVNYVYGRAIPNLTKNLVVRNSRYDAYTHEYLGDYLRFQRDYNKLNLMPLYNCFSNRICDDLQLNFEQIYLKSTLQKRTYKPINMRDTSTGEVTELPKEYWAYGSKLAITPEDYLHCWAVLPYGNDGAVRRQDAADITKWKLVFIEDWATLDSIKIGLTSNGTTVIEDLAFLNLKKSTGESLFTAREAAQKWLLTQGCFELINQHFESNGLVLYFEPYSTELSLGELQSLTYGLALDSQVELREQKEQEGTTNTVKVAFESSDAHYKIYMLPVKLFNQYTIAIDSQTPVEICCGFIGKRGTMLDKENRLAAFTYAKYPSLDFNSPVLYSALYNIKTFGGTEDELIRWAQNEIDLKMFIKLPAGNTSTITVLEGNYARWGDSATLTTDTVAKGLVTKINHSIINMEGAVLTDVVKNSPKLITPLQLLRLNTGESYPFADRLVEYLLGNVVTHLDNYEDNIVRVQELLKHFGSPEANTSFVPKLRGYWEPELNALIYSYLTAPGIATSQTHDILGFADKDVEKCLQATIAGKPTTLRDIDLYPDMYNGASKHD